MSDTNANTTKMSSLAPFADFVRIIGALVAYAVGIMVLLLSTDAPRSAIAWAGLLVVGLTLWVWIAVWHGSIHGQQTMPVIGLALTATGFLVGLVATVGGMIAVIGAGFVAAAAGMCLGSVRR